VLIVFGGKLSYCYLELILGGYYGWIELIIEANARMHSLWFVFSPNQDKWTGK